MSQAYKIFTKICLNNWHYIDHKVLELHENINFFTGHSGSGKSTVIDAMQIVLYANSDGRGFFNKAAADDSDRSLIEYLRGMINIGENNQATYKRNQNFSTTIVLEMEQTVTKEKECIGVVFDVETATNEISRMFFWHKGAMMTEHYRTGKRAMTLNEVREYLHHNFSKEEVFYTSGNERFRERLYDVYLGGLDKEKFPQLFKRAIPFRMNIRLEDFVKEYICMEQDIHMEDLQESVVLYGRMCRKIEAALEEIRELEQIRDRYEVFKNSKNELEYSCYHLARLQILQKKSEISNIQEKLRLWTEDLEKQKEALHTLNGERVALQQEYDNINIQLADTGYALLEEKMNSIEASLVHLKRGEEKWKIVSDRLSGWEEMDCISNQALWDIEKFQKGTIQAEELGRLKRELEQVQKDADKEKADAASEARMLSKEIKAIDEELSELRKGKDAYPKELMLARAEIERSLFERHGVHVPVRIFAELIDIRDEKWRNAIEGYLGWNKLTLIVEPKYIKSAMDIYAQMDGKKYWCISLLDTGRLMEQEYAVKEMALAEEVKAKESYIVNFVNFLLGNVIKCDSIDALRRCKIGVTADCMLYQNFQLRRLNPENYTKRAYIGEKSKKQRQKELTAQLEKRKAEYDRYQTEAEAAAEILRQEFLPDSVEEYRNLISDIAEKKKKQKEKLHLEKQMQELNSGIVERLKQEREAVQKKKTELDTLFEECNRNIWQKENDIKKEQESSVVKNEELLELERNLRGSVAEKERFQAFIERSKTSRYEKLIAETEQMIKKMQSECEAQKNTLIDIRSGYLKNHPKRDFSASTEHNEDYEQVLNELQCGELEIYKKKAAEQAKSAVEHFKEDFIYKIRSAIQEAYVRRDELNRIIRNLNFGKDKYQFRIGKNKGSDGEFYDMFMDENLNIDPSTLSGSMDRQMNLFSMEHENKYGSLMSDLIHIFIPPEGASAAELEEAKKNMQKYSDYRTYLSFEMEQIVEGEERLVIGLSKMIKKNSGGEGQNPLYIALLASFAQAYRINLSARLSRRPTIRLVVLDEAFSKMDAEKVASCIDLIRSLGFQAIISATNDKIQNYIENVDKTFVYANPNKKSISIQEFEKKDFSELVTEYE